MENKEAREALQSVHSIEERTAAVPLPWAKIAASSIALGVATFFAKQEMWVWTLVAFAVAIALIIFASRRPRGVRTSMKQPTDTAGYSKQGVIAPFLVFPIFMFTPSGILWVSVATGIVMAALMAFLQVREHRA